MRRLSLLLLLGILLLGFGANVHAAGNLTPIPAPASGDAHAVPPNPEGSFHFWTPFVTNDPSLMWKGAILFDSSHTMVYDTTPNNSGCGRRVEFFEDADGHIWAKQTDYCGLYGSTVTWYSVTTP